MPETWADTQALKTLINYLPETDIKTGVKKFVTWYKEYYEVSGSIKNNRNSS